MIRKRKWEQLNMVELNSVVNGGQAVYNELVKWNNEKAGAASSSKSKKSKKSKKSMKSKKSKKSMKSSSSQHA